MITSLKKLFRRQPAAGVFVGRKRTTDVSFLAQSPSGIIGRVTRSVPAPKIIPYINDATNPVAQFGLAVMATATGTVRNVLATDGSAVSIAGIAHQPSTFQASTATGYGAQAFGPSPCPPGPLGILASGAMTIYCNSATAATAYRGMPAFVYLGATTGTHIQGGFETSASATIASAAVTGNTGNGTIGALTVAAGSAQNGAYTVTLTGATTFTVVAPNGTTLAAGKTGTAYSDGGVNFTLTAGATAFVAGDSFTITVTSQTIALDPRTTYFAGSGDSSTGATEIFFNL